MMFEIDRYLVFAALAIAISLIRYGLYLRSIYRGETRPHVFSWFNWGVITVIGAYAQFTLNGGLSAWILAFVAATCLFISVLALFKGEKNITRSDWMAFIGALLIVPIWSSTDSPFVALLLISIIDILSYYPTFRKSWADPWGEHAVSYFWAGSRYFLTLFTIAEPTLQSLFYPFFLMLLDWSFAVYAIARRRVLVRAG